eukprot:Gb_05594 [translate_table: standard]
MVLQLIYSLLLAIVAFFLWITKTSAHRTASPEDSLTAYPEDGYSMNIFHLAPTTHMEPSHSASKETEKLMNSSLPRDDDELKSRTRRGIYKDIILPLPKVFPRSNMIPPEEINKEAEDFINKFRERMRSESKRMKMDDIQF